MSRRRSIACLFEALLVQLLLLGGGMACDPAATSDIPAGAVASHAHHHATTPQHEPAPSDHQPHHGASHCIAGSGCAVVATPTVALVTVVERPLGVRILGHVARPCALAPLAPEPPPPRA